MVEGEAADRGWGLCVEEHEQAGDPVDGMDGVIVQQPPGLRPAGLGVDGAGWPMPSGSGELQDAGLVQPRQHEVGAIAAAQIVVQAAQLGADVAVVIGEQDLQPLPQVATGARSGAELTVPAGRAASPEGRVRAGAGCAQRLGDGATADQLDPAAAHAACPPLLAGLAPRPAGGLRDLAGRGPAAD